MRKATIIVLVLLVSVGIGAASMTAAAQTNGTNESNATNESVESVDELSDELPSESTQENIRVDEDVTITAFEWDAENEVFRVEFENDGRPSQVTVTESVQQPEGSGTFNIEQERLLPGTNEVALSVTPAGGEAAVSITTSASISDGQGVYLSTGISETSRPAIAWESAQLLIILTAVGSGIGAIRIVAKKREDEHKDAERLL